MNLYRQVTSVVLLSVSFVISGPLTSETARADFTANFVCSKIVNGNVNTSALFTIVGGQITIVRRVDSGVAYTDVTPRLVNSKSFGAADYNMSSPAPWWFSGENPFPPNSQAITAGPIRETDSALDIQVSGKGTYDEGRKIYFVRHALHLDKTTGLLSYLNQVRATTFSSLETRLSIQMVCQSAN